MGQVCLLVIFRVEIADVGLVQGVGVGHKKARHAVLPLNLEFAAYYFATELQGGPSGCTSPFVDVKTKVPSQYSLPKHNS